MIGTTTKLEALHVASISMAIKPHADIKIEFCLTRQSSTLPLSDGSAKSMALSYER